MFFERFLSVIHFFQAFPATTLIDVYKSQSEPYKVRLARHTGVWNMYEFLTFVNIRNVYLASRYGNSLQRVEYCNACVGVCRRIYDLSLIHI